MNLRNTEHLPRTIVIRDLLGLHGDWFQNGLEYTSDVTAKVRKHGIEGNLEIVEIEHGQVKAFPIGSDAGRIVTFGPEMQKQWDAFLEDAALKVAKNRHDYAWQIEED